MNRLLTNKYVAAGFVFVVFQWFAYSAFVGAELTDSERRRSKANAVEGVIFWLTDKIGNVPAAILLCLAGFALAYVAFRRVAKLTSGA